MEPDKDITAHMSVMGLAEPEWGIKGRINIPLTEYVSCRDMLRQLDKAGRIKLPAAQKPSRSHGSADIVRHFEHDTTPINTKLSQLRPLNISRVDSGKELFVSDAQ